MTVELEGRSIARLIPAFKSAQTQEGYLIKLRMFLEFCGLGPDEFVATARTDPTRAEELVTSYILARRETVSGSTMHNFAMALKLFLAMNDSDRLNWVRLGKIIPPAKKHGSDRAPTAEELRRILDSCDLRMKCVVLLMLSSGIRVGAFDYLRWRDVEPVGASNLCGVVRSRADTDGLETLLIRGALVKKWRCESQRSSSRASAGPVWLSTLPLRPPEVAAKKLRVTLED